MEQIKTKEELEKLSEDRIVFCLSGDLLVLAITEAALAATAAGAQVMHLESDEGNSITVAVVRVESVRDATDVAARVLGALNSTGMPENKNTLN